jgi:hypothetical protein
MNRSWMPLVVLAGALAAGRGVSEENAAAPKEVRDATQVFTERMIVVRGQGVAPTDRPLSTGQKEILALRAAKVVALRELAEILSGVRVSGETCIQDAAAHSDEIKASVNGLIKGAEVVHESYDEHKEVATVYVRLGLDGPSGLTQTLLPKMIEQKVAGAPPAKQYAPPAQAPPPSTEPADALIIDATGKNLRPALINRVVANNGNVLFEPSKIPPEILAKKGCGDYTSDLGKAKAIAASHGAKHPLVIKAAGVTRSTDATVSEADATVIFTENQRSNFLEGAQVVFVL